MSLSPASSAVPLRCVVVDDDPTALLIMEQCIARTPSLQFVKAFDAPLAALDFLRSQPVDILFLDVQMPLISGFDLLSLLKQMPRQARIIFITNSSDHAVEAFSCAVADYLVKPIAYPRFVQAVAKVKALPAVNPSAQLAKSSALTTESIFVKVGNQMVCVKVAELYYLEACGSYVHLFLEKRKLVIFSTLRALKERLPANQFFPIHRSFLVNIRHVDIVDGYEVSIKGKRLPISSLLRTEFLRYLDPL